MALIVGRVRECHRPAILWAVSRCAMITLRRLLAAVIAVGALWYAATHGEGIGNGEEAAVDGYSTQAAVTGR